MGNGGFSVADYSDRRAYQQATGADPFAHSRAMQFTPIDQQSVHALLDPQGRNQAGQIVRECLDTPEHPNATPIAVLFDETGSMGDIPRRLQEKLAELEGTVLRRGYVPDPQFAFGAIGDVHNREVAPLQVGQFESDNRLVDTLEAIFLEGNGGGNGGETYGLALYFMARHTRLDRVERHGQKGYLFITGDECPHSRVTRQEIRTYIGDEVEDDLTVEQLIKEVQAKFHLFFLHVRTGSSEYQGSLAVWQKLLGDHVIPLEDSDAVCETIALVIGRTEGTLGSLDEGIQHLLDAGANQRTAHAAGQALATLDRNLGDVAPKAGRTSAVATATGTGALPAPQDPGASGANRRL